MARKHHNIEKQRTRARHACPPKLCELIEEANLLPHGFRFDAEEILKKRVGRGEYLQSPVLNLFDYFFSLSEEISRYLYGSREYREYEKQDSWEYWCNNDGYAQDAVIDLTQQEAISEAERDEVLTWHSQDIASFLVEYGYYGDKYSYRRQLEVDDDREGDSFDKDFLLMDRLSPQIQALERLQNTREFLIALAELGKQIDPLIDHRADQLRQSQTVRIQPIDAMTKKLASEKLIENILATRATYDEEGRIHFELSHWAEAVQGVDVRRIRLCEVCNKLFWANRKDAYTCSSRHAKVRQMRQLRKHWKENAEVYLKARKKRTKQTKEAKNGSL